MSFPLCYQSVLVFPAPLMRSRVASCTISSIICVRSDSLAVGKRLLSLLSLYVLGRSPLAAPAAPVSQRRLLSVVLRWSVTRRRCAARSATPSRTSTESGRKTPTLTHMTEGDYQKFFSLTLDLPNLCSPSGGHLSSSPPPPPLRFWCRLFMLQNHF